MTKPLAASKDIMQNYLSELLTDNDAEVPESVVTVKVKSLVENKRLEKLLQNVSKDGSETEMPTKSAKRFKLREKVASELQAKKVESKESIKSTATSTITTAKSHGEIALTSQKNYRKGSFQAMFFDVSGLIIAVPLIELGGIHNTDKTTKLMGKPDWFKGVMLHRDDKINVVDTALWVMPEKCDETLINSLNYQYVIMLGNSQWGLMAEHLVDTVTLEQEEVKWLDKPSKRPWLAGLVKERKCALLDVEALIKLLDDGAGII